MFFQAAPTSMKCALVTICPHGKVRGAMARIQLDATILKVSGIHQLDANFANFALSLVGVLWSASKGEELCNEYKLIHVFLMVKHQEHQFIFENPQIYTPQV